MNGTKCIRASVLAALVGCLAALPAAQERPVVRDFGADLRLLHPEISSDPQFVSWFGDTGVGPWYETPVSPERRRQVVVQNLPGSRLFAALVSVGDTREVILRAPVDLAERGLTADAARAAGEQLQGVTHRALRPVVVFAPRTATPFQFRWEFEVVEGPDVWIYTWSDKSKKPERLTRVGPARVGAAAKSALPPGGHAVAPTPDDLASNDLHHVPAFAQEAALWTAGLIGAGAIAKQLHASMEFRYSYSTGGIIGITDFTWADDLTRGQNHRSGECDELAVVAVTYFRALDIPARLKLFTWTAPGGRPGAHTALEYFDGKGWRHFDRAGLHDPGVYLKSGFTNIVVEDAMSPADVRSVTPADISGDGRLHPILDFAIHTARQVPPHTRYSH